MSQGGRFQIRIVGPNGERVERLDRAELVIGRSAQADIVVAHVEVSRKHAILKIEGQQVTLIDDNSKNGTFLDDQRLPVQSPRVWQQGQQLRLGLAPERLHLEVVQMTQPMPDAPPPTDAVISRTATRKNPIREISVKAQVREGSIKGQVREGSFAGSRSAISIGLNTSPRIDVGVVARAEPLKPVTSAGTSSSISSDSKLIPPSGVGDLERRVQELLNRAEAEARAIKINAEQAAQLLKANLERDTRQAQDDLQAARLEKAKLESQVRELEHEVRSRADERKLAARELAEAKLKAQNLEQEMDRLMRARDQLGLKLGEELKEVEAKLTRLNAEADSQGEVAKTRAQKEIKEQLETAKRQADLLMAEAELKAKNLRDKIQAELNDARRQAELDLAEKKLKTTAELKSQQDQEEARTGKARALVIHAFIEEVRSRCDQLVYSTNMESAVKLRLLTTIEETLHKHFVGHLVEGKPLPPVNVADKPMAIGKMLTAEPPLSAQAQEEVTGEVSITKASEIDEEEPPKLQKFNFKIMSFIGAGLMVLSGTWLLLGEGRRKQILEIAAFGPAETARTVLISPPSGSSVASVRNLPLPPTPPPPPAPPTANADVADSTPGDSGWTDVLNADAFRDWQDNSSRYLQRSLKIDKRKVSKYQSVESKYSVTLNGLKTRSPAADREREKVEGEFVREATQVLGAPTVLKLTVFRDSYRGKKQ